MKLLGLEIRPSREDAAVSAVDELDLRKAAKPGEYGTDADAWIADYLGGGPDVNPLLTGVKKYEVYDEMRKTDPAIKSLLWLPKLSIRGAKWSLDPADEDPVSLLVRDFVAHNLGLEDQFGELDLTWDEQLQQALLFLDWGVMFEELIWDEIVTWRDADGDEHLVRPLARLAPRAPATVQRVTRDRRGRIEMLEQILPGSQPIPGEKLTYFVTEREGRRWEGTSMMRPCWGAWSLKKQLMIAAGIGWDRFASGLPVLWHPDNPKAEALAKKIARGIRQHERGYATFPKVTGGKDDQEWLLEILNGSDTLADPTPLLHLFDEQIAKAGLQQFSVLGQTGTGSRAVGDVLVDPFYKAVEGFAFYVARQRARDVVRRIVRVNFGEEIAEKASPQLTVSKIQMRNVVVIAQAIGDLANAGLTFTDREAVDDVRELLGMPRLPNDLEQEGIDLAQLEQILRDAGLDDGRLQEIIAALPPEIGIARNRVPTREGDGLPTAA